MGSACRSIACPGRRPPIRQEVLERDPLGAAGPAASALPSIFRIPLPMADVGNARRSRQPLLQPRVASSEPAPVGKSQPGVVRTALCIEPRGGIMYIFMPPVAHLEDYLDLVAAIETTAAELAMPVQLEGYGPPHDHRLTNFKVTPDPGVIEVNIHPAPTGTSWPQTTRIIYDEAHQSRLCDRKVHARRPAHRHGRRQPHRSRRAAPRPTARCCGGRICCAAWSAIGTTIRPCRTCFPGCSSARPARPRASMKPATTASTSWKSPSSQIPERDDSRALARRPHLPPSAGRSDRQHAPGRVLHRQALFARHGRRPPRPAGISRLRDAAALADEPGAAAAAAGAGRPLLGPALSGAARPLGNRAARPVHAAAFHPAGLSRRAVRAAAGGLCLSGSLVRAAL